MTVRELSDAVLRASIERFLGHRRQIVAAFERARQGRFASVEPPERVRRFLARERAHGRAAADRLAGGRPRGDGPSERGGDRRPVGRPPRRRSPAGRLERVFGGDDLLSIEFLEEGLLAARPVGLITVADCGFGTGFLVGNGLLLTNQHVLPDPDAARASVFALDYETNRIGAPKPVEQYRFAPERFFHADAACDFALVALEERSEQGRPLAEFGYHPLIADQGKIVIGRPVNLIQHPGGRHKSIVVHDSRLMFLCDGGELDRYCWYSSDTEPGSSGSPVFNNHWEVVALHHKAIPKVNARGQLVDRRNRPLSARRAACEPEALAWAANEGIRVSRIVAALREARLPDPLAAQRDALLALWAAPRQPATPAAPCVAVAPAPEGPRLTVTATRMGSGDALLPLVITVRLD